MFCYIYELRKNDLLYAWILLQDLLTHCYFQRKSQMFFSQETRLHLERNLAKILF